MDEPLSADVVVVGMGPGGDDVAGRLAEAGQAVVGVDRELVGGECPYWGCVPSKMMVRAAGLLAEARRGIVVATGTRAAIPSIPGLEQVPRWTNREAIEAKELPSSLIVLGGGAVGVELAQVFARFGVEVTVIEALDRLVPGEEPEAGRLLAEVFERERIAVRTAARVGRVRRDGARVAVDLDDGTSFAAAQLLVAAGRRAVLAAVGLSAVGGDESQRWVPVDDHMRVVGADGVWAVGDITGKGAFTHVAMYQSPIAVADILGDAHSPAEYGAVPRVAFTDPEIGAVGLTEAQAREA